MAEFHVKDSEAGISLEQFLLHQLPLAPAGYLRQLLKSGKIRNSEGPLSATRVLQPGDHIHLPDSARLNDLLEAAKQPQLVVLYESPQLLIVDKPAGLATHAGQGHQQQNLTALVAAFLKKRGDHYMAAPIQRLDRDTSGVVLFGKGKKSCSVLGKMMMNAPVGKNYLALVAGRVRGEGTLTAEIPAKGKYKTAVTSYQSLQDTTAASLLRITLLTGRQHQIRRQFQQIGHPLFGDRRYGGPCPDGLQRLFLHCEQISFTDPFTEHPLSISTPLPTTLTAFLSSTGCSPSEPISSADLLL